MSRNQGSSRIPNKLPKGGLILVADDEEDVVGLVASSLQTAGFEVISAHDGPAAVEAAQMKAPALIILDLMLPGLSGFEVCRLLKGDPRTYRIPIIMLSAKAQVNDRVEGLELGADDYVTKPFSTRELVLRVKSVVSRAQNPTEAVADSMTLCKITVHRHTFQTEVGGRPVALTPTEFKLLTLLMERSGRVQSRESLLTEVWGYDGMIDTRTVDIHVRRLREKLGHSAACIETVRGFGYLFDASAKTKS